MPDEASTQINELLEDSRPNIEVTPEELEEGRRRRRLIADAVTGAFPGSRHFFSGSLAHRDALTPLNDVDLGVVIGEAGVGEDHFGPEANGPTDPMETARDTIREAMADEFDRLRVTVEGQRRAVRVFFGSPVSAGEDDFTADVIIALDNPDGGLWIPDLDAECGWGRSDPEGHTRMVADVISDTNGGYAHTVRWLKHWNRTHGQNLCTWNIKALALDCLTGPAAQLDALATWFEYADEQLSKGLTSDPAGVNPEPIGVPDTLTAARNALRRGRTAIELVVTHVAAGRVASAQYELASLLPDAIEEPDPDPLKADTVSSLASGAYAGVGAAAGVTLPNTRSWAP